MPRFLMAQEDYDGNTRENLAFNLVYDIYSDLEPCCAFVQFLLLVRVVEYLYES